VNPALTTAPLSGEKRCVARSGKQRFVELLRFCSCNISPACCLACGRAAKTMRIGLSPAFTFAFTMGVVDLFCDITYEGGGGISGRQH
jgi:hypothetical protein